MLAKKTQDRQRRHRKIRKRILGSIGKPRLVIYRSLSHIYGQLIDDRTGTVIASSSTLRGEKGDKSSGAKDAGVSLAKKAKEKKISICVFDRAGYKYHGRVKSFAEGAREGGLKF